MCFLNKSLVNNMRVIFVLNIPLTADKTWLINKSMEYEEDFNDFYFGQFLTSIEYVFYFYFMSIGHHKLLLNSKNLQYTFPQEK